MINKSHVSIVEELHAHRSGKILESVTKSVTSAVDKFYKEQKTPSQVRKRINNILNFIYLKCNDIGKNNFVGGSHDYTRGDVVDFGDGESGPDPKLFPSIYEVDFEIKFVDRRQDFNKVYSELSKLIQKEAKSNYKEFEQDAFSINIAIDSTFDDMEGYGISIEKTSSGIKICLFRQVNPYLVREGAPQTVKSIKYFKGKDPWDRFKFEFIPWRDKKDKLFIKVNMENEYWDSGDYAFIDASNPEITNIHSYSDVASKSVLKALKAAGYTKKELQNILKELKMPINEANEAPIDPNDVPYIQPRKSPEEVEKEEKAEDEKIKKEHEKENAKKEKVNVKKEHEKADDKKEKEKTEGPIGNDKYVEDGEDDEDREPEEASALGTEIGLPIDKENCESTSVAGVATPTGTLNTRKRVIEGFDSVDTEDMTIECPECGSQNINVHDSTVFHCPDCGYEWKIDYDEEEEKAVHRDTALDNTYDESPLAYNRYMNNTNNIYMNPNTYSNPHLNEGVASAKDLLNDLHDAISKSGEIEYMGSDFVEVNATKNLINDLEKHLKKKYKVSKANNRLSVDGGDEYHYIEVGVKPKVGNKNVFVVDYDIPI